MRIRMFALLAGVACVLCFSPAEAHDTSLASAQSHAPIGVMGDHMHRQGEWMLGYRFMHMEMSGNRKGSDAIAPATIVTTEQNRFYGAGGQPPTLRVVPDNMTTDMHMMGVMYAPTDWLTLIAMGNYVDKEMSATTYAGMMGATVLGTFHTTSEGWGDVRMTGAFRLYDDRMHHLQLNAGVSVPTGSITEKDDVLAPNGTRPTMRLAYGMQLGTGTYDFMPGLSYSGHDGKWGWGAQYALRLPMEDANDEGYRWGVRHDATVWGSYEWERWISTSIRLAGSSEGKIHGIDPQIVAPVQSADPDNYGGRQLELGFGVNLFGTAGAVRGHRLAFEARAPLYSDLNGPQLEKDWAVTVGWQYAF